MRLIDIYLENSGFSTGFRLIAQNLIQIEDNVLTRSRNAKTFVMADGSLLVYPAEKDKIQMTLKLECTEEQADLLGDAEHYGKLYFAGIHAGAKKTASPTDRLYSGEKKQAFAGYLTGNSRTEQIASDLYRTELPLQLDFSETKAIPVIETTFGAGVGFTIADQIQNFSDFVYLKDGFFHRKQVIFTSDTQIRLALPLTTMNSASLSGLLSQNDTVIQEWSSLSSGTYCECSPALKSGMNQFLLVFQAVQTFGDIAKPLKLQFSVYKFP